jgi:hypothetical protein
MAVMDRLEGSEIGRLLRFKGSSRLEVKDDLTERVLKDKGVLLPGGIKFCFIESKRNVEECGEWVDYKILYSILKCSNDVSYLQYVLGNASHIIGAFNEFNLDYISLDEFDCSRSGYYYALLYIRRDILEKEENEINKFFKEYE